MSKQKRENLIVGLDIGTSKILVIVAEVGEGNELEIIGVGHHPSKGLRKGVVANIESTVHSIQSAVEAAELTAGCQIMSVYAGIAGAHISSVNSHGVVAIRAEEVSSMDIERVIEAARALAIPTDQKVLHILPQDFIIDGQYGIRDPIGMSGIRLESKVHIVTGAVSAEQNILKCIRRCGLETDGIILEPLASSLAVLDEDEKDLGICLVDIGGGTTDIAIFYEGSIRHTAVLPIAGDQITKDIAVGLRTPTQAAEEIKKKYGCALTGLATEGETIDVPGVRGQETRKLSLLSLADVIEPRVEEIFLLVQAEIQHNGFEEILGAGIVLTGGSSRMNGMSELAEKVFRMSVRLGLPKYVGGLSEVIRSPIYSTAIGLVLFGQQIRDKPPVSHLGLAQTQQLIFRMKDWLRRQFSEEGS